LSHADERILTNKTHSKDKDKKKDTHKIRVFPTIEDQQTHLRSNPRCQLVLNRINKSQYNNHGEKSREEMDLRLGYLGKCILTDLSFFDHGYSFLMDTLHTIYHGAFVRIDFFILNLFNK
jgi:hypothetical protein